MNGRSRPQAAPEVTAATNTSVTAHNDDTGQTRARRCRHARRGHCTRCVNARRSAQLALEGIAPVHTPLAQTVLVRVVGRHSVQIDVGRAGFDVLEVIDGTGSKWMRDKARHGLGWLIPQQFAETVLTALTAAGYVIQETL